MYFTGSTWQARHVNEEKTRRRIFAHLHVALGDIERGNTGVGDTASKDTTEHALGIVRGVVGHRAEIPVE